MSDDYQHILHQLKAIEQFHRPWYVCGGWALDMFLGKQTRLHHDLDIGLFRKDHLYLQDFFADSRLYWIDNGAKQTWEKGHYLELPIHEIWREQEGQQLEFVLNECRETEWIYRRNAAIKLPMDKLIYSTQDGIPYLAPEVVLLYKSNNPTGKNQQDFEAAFPHLE
jgi:hypothetical protein